jgi:putative hemolysin
MLAAPLWLIVVLVGLLLISGACSSSEAALFSLKAGERQRAGSAARDLLARPSDLLVTILLVNQLANVTFFTLSDRLFPAAAEDDGLLDNVATLFGSLVAVLVFGEILPKTLGLRARVPLARLAAPVWVLLVSLLGPARRLLVRLLDVIGRRLERGGDERALEPHELADMLEDSARQGGLLDHEADLLAELVELKSLKVREIMTPRVDGIFLELDGSDRAQVLTQALERRMSWLPVVEGTADSVRGMVRVRDLLRSPERPVDSLVMPALFVPEVANCLDLLRTFRERRTAEAICVDEWGGTAGYVTIEELFEEIVGDLRVEGESREEAVVPMGEGVFKVPGSLSVRDWSERFGLDVAAVQFETVGGLVTAQLGRIPRNGDTVMLGGLELVVDEVRGRRVLSVRVRSTAAALPPQRASLPRLARGLAQEGLIK